MKLKTASETISFLKELEEKSSQYYEELSQRYSRDKDDLLSFAMENKKYFSRIRRAYYSVITDAIEGGYAFDLDTDNYIFETELAENTSYLEALDKALKMEKKIINYYTDAAEQSESLMADIPRNFLINAKKRKNRISKLIFLSSK